MQQIWWKYLFLGSVIIDRLGGALSESKLEEYEVYPDDEEHIDEEYYHYDDHYDGASSHHDGHDTFGSISKIDEQSPRFLNYTTRYSSFSLQSLIRVFYYFD